MPLLLSYALVYITANASWTLYLWYYPRKALAVFYIEVCNKTMYSTIQVLEILYVRDISNIEARSPSRIHQEDNVEVASLSTQVIISRAQCSFVSGGATVPVLCIDQQPLNMYHSIQPAILKRIL